LTDEQARFYTVENLLRGTDDWNPTRLSLVGRTQ
jgi:hypothetical protein